MRLFRHSGLVQLLPATVLLLAAAPAQQASGAEPALDELIAAARSYRAARVAEAVEALGRRGAAAAAALPELRAILDRPDPRVLQTGETVPLRRAAATAILQIAAGGADAAAARAVLAGAPPPAARPVPERAAARVAELVRELADPKQRAAAAANLLALGELSALPLVEALRSSNDPALRSAALSILAELGPQASAALPQLFAAIGRLRIEETPGWCEAMATVAPFSRDVLPAFDYRVRGGNKISVFGLEPAGSAAPETATAFCAAADRLQAALAIDPGCSLDELRQLLHDRPVLVREHALVIVRTRGSAAIPLLPGLGEMLVAEQPPSTVTTVQAGGSIVLQKIDRSPVAHRLAARAILAIAPDGDPLRKEAQQVLAANR